MSSHVLFTDVSVNPQSRLGVGVCLLLPIQFLNTHCDAIDRAELSSNCFSRRFTDTSSTLLELQTVIWGLSLYKDKVAKPLRVDLQLYTDSQSVVGLSRRRESLESNGYHSLRTGLPLANASLYRDFFIISDELGFEVVKIVGHSRASAHDSLKRIFSVVDRCARRELGLWLNPEKYRD